MAGILVFFNVTVRHSCHIKVCSVIHQNLILSFGLHLWADGDDLQLSQEDYASTLRRSTLTSGCVHLSKTIL